MTFWNVASSPRQSLHICSSRKSCISPWRIPFSFLMWYFRRAHADSASWVWIPVTGSTKLSRWTTVLCTVTLGTCTCKFLYAAQSSLCTSEPGRSYSLKNLSQSCSVSSFHDTELTPTGRISVEMTPKTQTSSLAVCPLSYYNKLLKEAVSDSLLFPKWVKFKLKL